MTHDAKATAEIERLLHQAQVWLLYVQTNRSAGPATQSDRLEALLASPAERGGQTR